MEHFRGRGFKTAKAAASYILSFCRENKIEMGNPFIIDRFSNDDTVCRHRYCILSAPHLSPARCSFSTRRMILFAVADLAAFWISSPEDELYLFFIQEDGQWKLYNVKPAQNVDTSKERFS